MAAAPHRSPALAFPPELLLAARGAGDGIAAAIFDVDGVLTDGRIYIGERGETFKAFSTLDGHGLKLLAAGRHRADRRHRPRFAGGAAPRRRPRHRARRLRRGRQARRRRSACSTALGLGWDRVAVMGDDWPDLPLLRARRLRLRAAERARRGARGGRPRHRRGRRPRRGARVLRPAADRRRPLRRAAARPAAAPLDGAR